MEYLLHESKREDYCGERGAWGPARGGDGEEESNGEGQRRTKDVYINNICI